MSEYAAPLLWSFLPAQLTAALLPTLSGLAPRLLPPAPPGTPGYTRNFRRVITALVLGWLAYAFFTDRPDEKGGDWYDLLGVPVRVGEDGLKKAFRGLSRKFHPDKIGPNPGRDVEARFVAIRAAYEALGDPVRRFAYDRFGPDIENWQGAKTVRDYMMAGVQRAAGFYVVTVGLLLAL
ncbi:DnaJ-domain-containing protein, partial [Cutaneotrichosporon oleaginosum]